MYKFSEKKFDAAYGRADDEHARFGIAEKHSTRFIRGEYELLDDVAAPLMGQ